MAGIVVKPRARILHGHDWVFSSEVLKVFGNPMDGDVISLKDGKDHLIGSAIYNSKSQSSHDGSHGGNRISIWISSSGGSGKRPSTAHGDVSIQSFVVSCGAKATGFQE